MVSCTLARVQELVFSACLRTERHTREPWANTCRTCRVKAGTHAGLQEREIFFRALYTQIQAVSHELQLHISICVCDMVSCDWCILMAWLLTGHGVDSTECEARRCDQGCSVLAIHCG